MNKKLTEKLAPGHTTCAGCGIPPIVRAALAEIKDPVVVVNATGCLEVTTTVYPYTAWKVPYIHNAFENAAATAAGIDAAQNALRKKNGLKKKAKIVVFAGDGATYDIGLQSLSGALERKHDFLYICYDNQGYMNTGGQRSGASPYGADTQTTPFAANDIGNNLEKKDIMKIVAAHGAEYAAQSNVAYLEDFRKKIRKAAKIKGPAFLLVLQPCVNEWKFPSSMYVRYGRLATETNFWPLYEINKKGEYKINLQIKKRKPIEEFLEGQGRFSHLFVRENKKVIKEMQKRVDERWKELQKLSDKKP